MVPNKLRAIIGKTEVRRTLRTKDPREAARRFHQVAAKVAAEWEELRRGPTTEELAREFVNQLHEPSGLAQDIHEAHLRAAGVLDERQLPPDWEPIRTPATQKAISRLIERRGLAPWLESYRGNLPTGRPSTCESASEADPSFLGQVNQLPRRSAFGPHAE